MAQHYSDPARADDPHALPDVETFYRRCEKQHQLCSMCQLGTTKRLCEWCSSCRHLHTGPRRWFYWFCFPGCLPDSDPVGPFATEAEALADAREGVTDAD